jgi:hypothetical protein
MVRVGEHEMSCGLVLAAPLARSMKAHFYTPGKALAPYRTEE